jgi:hypothetical protein
MRAVLVFCLALLPCRLALAEAIELRAAQVPLNPRDAGESRAGSLKFLSGFELASSDPRWGGFSSMILTVAGDGLVAVSDFGDWLRLGLHHDVAGRLTGVGAAEMGFLPGPDGRALGSKGAADAEALAEGPDGGLLVAFERNPRIWLYDGAAPPFAAAPVAFPAPKAILALPRNGGVESLATLPSGDIVALAEGAEAATADIPGWLYRDARWHPIAWIRTLPYRPTDATVLPDGDLLVVERRYSLTGGPGARLSIVPAASIGPGARLAGRLLAELRLPQTLDNFESVAARAAPDGATLIYLLSDDNRSLLQRTLLLQFRWAPDSAALRQ